MDNKSNDKIIKRLNKIYSALDMEDTKEILDIASKYKVEYVTSRLVKVGDLNKKQLKHTKESYPRISELKDTLKDPKAYVYKNSDGELELATSVLIHGLLDNMIKELSKAS